MAVLRATRRTRRDTEPALEIVYYQLLKEIANFRGISRTYYAVGSAANYSLLYLIARVLVELKPASVLDIGCGQSTLLINDLVRTLEGPEPFVTSLDHDAHWAGIIAAQVRHRVVTSPLRRTNVAGHVTDTYDWSLPELMGPFNLAVVDGPIGRAQFSRVGALALAGRMAEDFVIIMDDVDRQGERDTADLLLASLRARGMDVREGWTRAAKSQRVFAGGAFEAAAYF